MKIGFKNFKKFKDFPMIELAPITFLVGANNSGKSSFIKALTLLFFNLKPLYKKDYFNDNEEELLENPFKAFSLWIRKISFYQLTMSHLGWGDFETCLNNECDTREITFSLQDDRDKYIPEKKEIIFEFSFGATEDEIENDPSLSFSLPVNSFKTIFKSKGFSIINKYFDGTWHNYIELANEEVFKCISWLKEFNQKLIENKDYQKNSILNESLQELIHSNDLTLEDLVKKEDGSSVIIEITDKNINNSFCNYYWTETKHVLPIPELYISDVEYIEAHYAHHSQLFSKENKNDYLAQTILEFYDKITLDDNDADFLWLQKWMRKFEIGSYFKISPQYGGEYFTVEISHTRKYLKNGKSSLGLLGTGSIHLFTILLRLCLSLYKIKKLTEEGDNGSIIMVIIEEPEINLHPKLQSLLADLFYDVFERSNQRIKIVIETHSEYIIRRSQVIVSENVKSKNIRTEEELKQKNPFKVFYFPKDVFPYDMQYRLDGKFRKKFDKGFFDEASNLAIELF